MTLASSTVLRVPAAARQRRGVLLLICLSMLTLFVLLGTAYMVVTSRARATARAFAKTTQTSAAQSVDGRRFLDKALLTVIRGNAFRGAQDFNDDLPPGGDLLGDRYGLTIDPARVATSAIPQDILDGCVAIKGQVTKIDQAKLGPLLARVNLSVQGGIGTCHRMMLQGRVITFTWPGFVWSTRILRAEGTSAGVESFPVVVALTRGPEGKPVQFSDLEQAMNRAAFLPGRRDFLINGREFTPAVALDPTDPNARYLTNEPYDGYDDANPFLAHIIPVIIPVDSVKALPFQSGTPSDDVGSVVVKRPSFGVGTRADRAIHPVTVDNDGDGVLDSIWLDLGFPVIPDGAGGFCRPRAAVLITDLDSRLNVNLHGSLEQAETLENTESAWPAGAENIPEGSGYGPAEARLADIFITEMGDAGSVEALLRLRGLLEGELPPPSGGDPQGQARRSPPTISSSPGLGRYGASGVPGKPGNDQLSQVRDERRGRPEFQGGGRPPAMVSDWLASRGVNADSYSSPHDLKGAMKVFAATTASDSGVVATLRYAKRRGKGQGGPPGQGGGNSGRGPWHADCDDDPYEIRPGQATVDDALFSVDELERILRVYDWDISQVPPRLAALLGTHAERLRMLLTSEQWDTTAIVGPPRLAIERGICRFDQEVLDDSLPSLVAPEVLGGRRFDLNRPVIARDAGYDGTTADETEMYCRGLYTLAWLLTYGNDEDPDADPPTPAQARTLAQWAVNVLDFRDADSRVTRFAFVPDPREGWAPAQDDEFVVWGVERPEIVITEATAWRANGDEGGVYLMLHRPWHTENFEGSEQLNKPRMRISDAADPAFETDPDDPKNLIDLTALGGEDEKSPVWRIKVGDKVVRFDKPAQPATGEAYADQGPAERTLATNSWLCVYGKNGSPVGKGSPVGGDVSTPDQLAQPDRSITTLFINQPSALTPPTQAAAEPVTIALERLADPQRPHDPDARGEKENPYITIDSVKVTVSDRTPDLVTFQPREQYRVYRREPATFWPALEPDRPDLSDAVKIGKLTAGTSPAPWMPFLNRPFTSIVELALVPVVPSDQLLAAWQPPQGNGMLGLLAQSLGYGGDTASKYVDAILSATIIPSRFSGVSTTVDYATDAFGNASQAGLEQLPVDQIDLYREPGRINLNTVVDERVWDATVYRGRRDDFEGWPSKLAWSQSNFGGREETSTANPAKSRLDLLGLEQNSEFIINDGAQPGPDPELNSQFRYLTANRLANMATNRSHVFAVWVTVGFFECDAAGDWTVPAAPREIGTDTGQVHRHRGFAIVDRSIPVAYETGVDHNVRDTIRLWRVIQ